MSKPAFAALVVAFAAAAFLSAPRIASAAEEGMHLPEQDWSFEGIFGQLDHAAAQRGLQVYREVCSGCHALKYIAFRNLADLGYDEEQIKAFAAEATVTDGPNDEGEMFERDGRASDYFPSPFPNAKAAAALNNGAAPPDLSLMVKARAGGPNYLYGILTGYEEPPSDVELLDTQHYNAYFPGNKIAMPPPLADGSVEYADGTEASLEQMSHDVATFLAWTAEPEMGERKRSGIKVVLFLIVLTAMLYAIKRQVWADVEH